MSEPWRDNHLWFSNDAQMAGRASADTYSRIMPARKKYCRQAFRVEQTESKVEKAMKPSAARIKAPHMRATEAVAYYLLSDMGFDDKTPRRICSNRPPPTRNRHRPIYSLPGIAESIRSTCWSTTQEAKDATNLLTGTAQKSDVPVFDVTEQMPADQSSA